MNPSFVRESAGMWEEQTAAATRERDNALLGVTRFGLPRIELPPPPFASTSRNASTASFPVELPASFAPIELREFSPESRADSTTLSARERERAMATVAEIEPAPVAPPPTPAFSSMPRPSVALVSTTESAAGFPAPRTSRSATPLPATTSASPSAPAPTTSYMPSLAPAVASDAPASTRSSLIASGLTIAAALALVVGGHIGMSAAAFSLAAVLLSDLAVARKSIILSLFGGALALFALPKSMHGLGEMAFVAGLLVLIALVLALILTLVALVAARRTEESFRVSFTGSWLLRVGAILVVSFTSYQAFKTYTAIPDAYAAMLLSGIALVRIAQAIRRRNA